MKSMGDAWNAKPDTLFIFLVYAKNYLRNARQLTFKLENVFNV